MLKKELFFTFYNNFSQPVTAWFFFKASLIRGYKTRNRSLLNSFCSNVPNLNRLHVFFCPFYRSMIRNYAVSLTKDWTIKIKPNENLLPWTLLVDISSSFLANKRLSGLKIKLSGIIQWRTKNANTINNRREDLPFLHNDGLHWTEDMKRGIIKWFSKIIMIMLCTD